MAVFEHNPCGSVPFLPSRFSRKSNIFSMLSKNDPIFEGGKHLRNRGEIFLAWFVLVLSTARIGKRP